MSNRELALLQLLIAVAGLSVALWIPGAAADLMASADFRASACHRPLVWREAAIMGPAHPCHGELDWYLYYSSGWFGWDPFVVVECNMAPGKINSLHRQDICPIQGFFK